MNPCDHEKKYRDGLCLLCWTSQMEDQNKMMNDVIEGWRQCSIKFEAKLKEYQDQDIYINLVEKIASLEASLEQARGAYAEAHKLLGTWPLFTEGQDKQADALVILHQALAPLPPPSPSSPKDRVIEAARECIRVVQDQKCDWNQLMALRDALAALDALEAGKEKRS